MTSATISRFLLMGGVCLVAWSVSCEGKPVSGGYVCVPGQPGTCPTGWYCRLTADLDRTYRCFSTVGPVLCADGTREEGEECDGSDLGGEICQIKGFAGGELRCSSSCSLTTALCVDAVCGDGVLQGGEVCDGSNMGDVDCLAEGFGPGEVGCFYNCTADYRSCEAPLTCGNGVREVQEQCDGTDVDITCEAIGFPGGTVACRDNCSLDTSGCLMAICGNGVAESDHWILEECDGGDVRGVDCEAIGYGAGLLGCLSDCRFDTSQCEPPLSCGNGVREGTEACDASDFGEAACTDLGFDGGQLACSARCELNTAHCLGTADVGCGNGILERGLGERCDDGNNLSGDGCSADCLSDEICGNGTTDSAAGEECDDGNTTPGDGCDAVCQLEFCGNDLLDDGEVCDDGNHDSGDGCSADCLSLEVCGNEYIDTAIGEECDDGNLTDEDGCSDVCLLEFCGNGHLDAGEECDDGNNTSGDGCSWDCLGEGMMVCGDNIISAGEDCDGTLLNGATCVSLGYASGTLGCTEGCSYDALGCVSGGTCGDGTCDIGEDPGNCPQDCSATGCGNGTMDPGEICDDGNTSDGDGCSADCRSDESCGTSCSTPPANGLYLGCEASACLWICDDGYGDLNGDLQTGGDGCEFQCPIWPTEVETCDGVDQDCDGVVDFAQDSYEPNPMGSPELIGSGNCSTGMANISNARLSFEDEDWYSYYVWGGWLCLDVIIQAYLSYNPGGYDVCLYANPSPGVLFCQGGYQVNDGPVGLSGCCDTTNITIQLAGTISNDVEVFLKVFSPTTFTCDLYDVDFLVNP